MKHGGVTKFSIQNLLGPIIVLILLTHFVGGASTSLQLITQSALCLFVMVLALQVFVGNSGVLSFGHGAFALVGSYVSAMLTAPVNIKDNALAMNQLWEPLVSPQVNIYVALVISAAVSALIAAITGLFLMRLNGLAAGIATFALLGVAYNVFFNNKKIGPGSQALPGVPLITNNWILLLLAVLSLIIVYFINISKIGRTLRATREDAMAAPALGISIFKVRLIAFIISGAVAGLADGMYSHSPGDTAFAQLLRALERRSTRSRHQLADTTTCLRNRSRQAFPIQRPTRLNGSPHRCRDRYVRKRVLQALA